MAKRRSSIESDEMFKTKCSNSDTTLNDVSSGLSGIFSLKLILSVSRAYIGLTMDVTGDVLNFGAK